MKITTELLDKLSTEAAESPRLRKNFDLRDKENDNSQRMLNALQKGTIPLIHRHQNSSETVVVLRGKIKEIYFDDNKNIIETTEISSDGPIFGINIPIGQWHSFEVMESNTVIISIKNGKYEPINSDDILI